MTNTGNVVARLSPDAIVERARELLGVLHLGLRPSTEAHLRKLAHGHDATLGIETGSGHSTARGLYYAIVGEVNYDLSFREVRRIKAIADQFRRNP